jgi:hypothetical protein
VANVASTRRYEKYIQNFGLKSEGNKSLGRTGFQWEDNNIKMDLKEIGWECVWASYGWLRVTAVAGSCENCITF